MKKYLMKKAKEKYDNMYKFYSKFEINTPSLEYMLYKKYPNNKWITFTVMNLTKIIIFIIWLLSLYYVSSISNHCNIRLAEINEYFNITGLNLNLTDFNITKSKVI